MAFKETMDFSFLPEYFSNFIMHFFLYLFVLPFVGHHLCAVLLFNSLDKAVSFEFLAGVCVCMCMCFPPCMLQQLMSLYTLPFYY